MVYFSSTGGESWAPVNFPASVSPPNLTMRGIVAQENRLYALLFVGRGNPASHLVMSRDDGATWQFADQGLVVGQQCVLSVAVPLTGATLFATTLSDCNVQISPTDPVQVWRSDNAGAQWMPVSSLEVNSRLVAVNVSGQAQPVLIYLGSHADLHAMDFSLDSGKTWQPIPSIADQGLSQGQIGMLPDGSMLVHSIGGFYAWKAGESSWHKVAPALAGSVLTALVVSDTASGKETLYVEVQPKGGNTYSFYSVDLA